ncbi:MAG: DUF3105 domain-containing protein [Chloroflexota bacterium]|nr:DUF3105 domain-containing protein [Chloroflexota bacterium]MDE2896313.1 DUF3105 domain-containing protein [Chloroflexota bacterium]
MTPTVSGRLLALLIGCAALALSACGGDSAGSGTWIDIRDRPELEIYDNEHTTNQQIHLVAGQTADYTVIPPYGEEHSPIPQPCGAYAATPTFEMVVHALEHGAVAIWYSPDDLGADDIEALTAITAKHFEDGDYVIQAPYGALGAPLMLIAWGVRLPLDNVEERAIDQFFDEFHDDAPEPLAAGGCPTAR